VRGRSNDRARKSSFFKRTLTMKVFRSAILAVALLTSPAVAWAEGAIAVSDDAGDKPSDAGYGIGFGDSKESAKDAALRKCKAMGNESCRVAVWFKKCGAYASSAERYGIGWGDSEQDAKDKSLDQCGGDHCRVVASDCED
jgi:hypothetical protein